MNYSILVAINENRGIGFQGKIPWKPDFYFLKKTLGKKLLVGKNTVLPNLQNREVIIANRGPEDIRGIDYVIGGAKIYASYINGANYIHISNMPNKAECDCFFPELPEHFLLYKQKQYKDFTVDIYKNMAVDFDYLKLARKILLRGPQTTQITFHIIKQNKQYLVPFINSKKLYLRGVLAELLFFLKGETNTKLLENKNVNIWKANTSREYLDKRGLYDYPEGEAGPIYGAQWVKQFRDVFAELKNNPETRRAVFTSWVPEEIPKMCLPPCHIIYQLMIINGKLNLSMYQRSADVFLGLPFNLGSCALMLIIFSEFLGIMPGYVTVSIGNAHIYKEHMDAVKEQFNAKIHKPAKVLFKKNDKTEIISYLSAINEEDFVFKYKSGKQIKAPIIF